MKYILILVFGIFSLSSIAQNHKEINLIVAVDEEIMTSLSNFRINFKSKEEKSIQLKYLPGKLTMTEDQYVTVFDNKDSEIIISFTAGKYDNDVYNQFDYKIPFEKGWLKENFCILTIYNLSKRKYRKIYKPVEPNVNYSFSIHIESSSIFKLK